MPTAFDYLPLTTTDVLAFADRWKPQRPIDPKEARTLAIRSGVERDVAAVVSEQDRRAEMKRGAAHFAGCLRHHDQIRGIVRDTPETVEPILNEAERLLEERATRQAAADIHQEIGARRARAEMEREPAKRASVAAPRASSGKIERYVVDPHAAALVRTRFLKGESQAMWVQRMLDEGNGHLMRFGLPVQQVR